MKNVNATYASLLSLLCVSNSWHAYAMELPTPSDIPYRIQMSVGQACPVERILDLPDFAQFQSAEKLPAHEQGANSTVYKWNGQIIKISKKVEPAAQVSKELEDHEECTHKHFKIKGV